MFDFPDPFDRPIAFFGSAIAIALAGVCILVIPTLYFGNKYQERLNQAESFRLHQIFDQDNLVKILEVNYNTRVDNAQTKYQRVANYRVVTCETLKRHFRFNIIQNLDPPKLPLRGEVWRVKIIAEPAIVFDQKQAASP